MNCKLLVVLLFSFNCFLQASQETFVSKRLTISERMNAHHAKTDNGFLKRLVEHGTSSSMNDVDARAKFQQMLSGIIAENTSICKDFCKLEPGYNRQPITTYIEKVEELRASLDDWHSPDVKDDSKDKSN